MSNSTTTFDLAASLATDIVQTFTQTNPLQQRRGNTLQQRAQQCLKFAAQCYLSQYNCDQAVCGEAAQRTAAAYVDFQTSLAAYGPLTGISNW